MPHLAGNGLPSGSENVGSPSRQHSPLCRCGCWCPLTAKKIASRWKTAITDMQSRQNMGITKLTESRPVLTQLKLTPVKHAACKEYLTF